MKKTIILSLIFAPLLSLILVATHITILMNHKHNDSQAYFKITPGDNFSNINYRLKHQNLIKEPRLFHYYTKYKDSLSKFKAGTFLIPAHSSMLDVFEILVNGSPILTSVTFPEGKNIYEFAQILEENNITSREEFISWAKNSDFINSLDIPGPTVEGYLFPETYKFSPESPAQMVLKTMIMEFRNKVKDIDFSHPFLTKHEIVILASIVEKETGAAFERPVIAGVFLNRLKKKMRLQSDPTTIYGIWHRYKGNIKKTDLLELTDYNTYKISRLPLGPIANPSLAAIKAVLNPQEHNYLYFVSKNDGTHVFSETYAKHNEAVNDFQKNVQNRKGKSWRDLKQN